MEMAGREEDRRQAEVVSRGSRFAFSPKMRDVRDLRSFVLSNRLLTYIFDIPDGFL
jgi:hypothetical protein